MVFCLKFVMLILAIIELILQTKILVKIIILTFWVIIANYYLFLINFNFIKDLFNKKNLNFQIKVAIHLILTFFLKSNK